MSNLKYNHTKDDGEAMYPAPEGRGLAEFLAQQGLPVPPELLQAFAQQNQSYSTPPVLSNIQGSEREITEEVVGAESRKNNHLSRGQAQLPHQQLRATTPQPHMFAPQHNAYHTSAHMQGEERMDVGQARSPSWTTTDKEETDAWDQEPPAGMGWARPAARTAAMPQGSAPQAYASAPQAQVQDEYQVGVAGVGDDRARPEEAVTGGYPTTQGAPPCRPPSPAAPAPVAVWPMTCNPQPHAPQPHARLQVSERLETPLAGPEEGEAGRGDMPAWLARHNTPPQHPPTSPIYGAAAAPQTRSPTIQPQGGTQHGGGAPPAPRMKEPWRLVMRSKRSRARSPPRGEGTQGPEDQYRTRPAPIQQVLPPPAPQPQVNMKQEVADQPPAEPQARPQQVRADAGGYRGGIDRVVRVTGSFPHAHITGTAHTPQYHTGPPEGWPPLQAPYPPTVRGARPTPQDPVLPG